MRKNLLPVLFLLFSVQAEAQLVKVWDQRYGGSSYETIQCVVPCANDNLLVSGSSSSGMSGDKSQASYGQDDYWVVCITGNGIKLWDAAYGGNSDDELTAAISTSDGGFLLGGYSYSGISGTKTQASQGGVDYWIVKTDSAGNYQWDKRFGGSSSDYLYSLCQTSDGGYILGGLSSSGISGDKSQSSWGNYDYWVLKIDSVGTKIWDKRFGGTSSDECYSVIQTPDGGYLLGGMSTSGISGDKSQSSWGGDDYWVLKIDSAGIKIWDKRFGTSYTDYCYSACTDGGDGIVLGGHTQGGISGDKTESSWGSNDFWIVHVDGAGNKVWDRRFGGTQNDDSYGNIYRTNDGGYISTGTSYSDISGDKTQDNLGIEQTWMVKCDATGTYVVDRTLLTTGHEETGFATATNEGCLVIVNNTSAGIGGDKSQSSQGSYDYFIAEYCVAGPPVADFNVPDTGLCQGQCIQYTDASFFPQTWSWSFPGGTPSTSTLANPTICYNATGTFDVQLIVTNMSGSDTIFYPGYITVSPQIATPTILQNGNVLTCSVTASSYQWYFNYVSIPGATNQSYTAAQTGLYSVMVINAYGCSALSSAFNFNVSVAIANFSASDSSFCQGSCLNFTDLSIHNPTTWSWLFIGASPSSSSAQNPSNICYNTAGIYPVTLTVTNQYGQSSITQTNFITVLPLPFAPTIIQNIDTLFCSANANSYQWYEGGNLINGATNSFYVASQSGNYTVEITDANGCSAFSTTYFFSFNIVAANFTVNDSSICEGTCIGFIDFSSYNPSSWLWSFPGASPSTSSSQNPSGICYNVPGIYSVTLTATNAFGQDTITIPDFIQVFSAPLPPVISQNGDTLFCSASATSYQWYLGGNAINGATNSIYLASQTGNYSVQITNAEGCTATSPVYSYSYDISVVNFSVNDSSFCEGSCLSFTDLSSNDPTSWSWSFPGGFPSSSSSQNPSGICYVTPGIYPVTLIVTNLFGTSSLIQSAFIIVFANPVAPVITQSIDTLYCLSAAVSYQWFYDGSIINGATNDFYVAPQLGDYSVLITDANGCTASTTVNVQVPAPMFIAQDTAICEKFCTTFIDQSTNNPVSWTWIFEEGTPPSSSDQNPAVCFNVPGTFDVTLITYDGNEYDTLLLYDYMTVFTTPALPTITVNGNMLTASSAYSYQWQLNSISIPGATNQTYLATQSGVYTLITTSADECSSQVSIDFNLVGVSTVFSGKEISIHPNPGNGIFIVSFSVEGFQKATLAVYDVIGKEIFNQSLSEFKEENNITLDLQSVSDGVYFIRLFEDEHFFTAKIVKQQND